jgi:hypothetical protein
VAGRPRGGGLAVDLGEDGGQIGVAVDVGLIAGVLRLLVEVQQVLVGDRSLDQSGQCRVTGGEAAREGVGARHRAVHAGGDDLDRLLLRDDGAAAAATRAAAPEATMRFMTNPSERGTLAVDQPG